MEIKAPSLPQDSSTQNCITSLKLAIRQLRKNKDLFDEEALAFRENVPLPEFINRFWKARNYLSSACTEYCLENYQKGGMLSKQAINILIPLLANPTNKTFKKMQNYFNIAAESQDLRKHQHAWNKGTAFINTMRQTALDFEIIKELEKEKREEICNRPLFLQSLEEKIKAVKATHAAIIGIMTIINDK